MRPWILLFIAGLLEVVWATGMKYTAGFTKLWPTLGTFAAMIASFLLLARAMQSLPLGVSYSVWVGIGAVGSVLTGVLLLHERLSAAQVVCLMLIGIGVAGLKHSTPASPPPAVRPAQSP
ncbi:Guanidinium exporter [Phycisphaerales bacterium]|nr:Guanidinium exporter [Phycisphaerales bacterium]